MPSLWKRKKSPFWVCCYTAHDGQRLKKTTKKKDKAEAWALCVELERAEERARQGTLTESHARKIISGIVEKTTGEPLAYYTAERWCNDWVNGKKKTKSPATFERYKHVIDDFIEHLGRRARLNIAHLTPKDISTFRDAQEDAGKSAKTCNLAVKTVSGALNAAHRQGYIAANPARALEALTHEAETKGVFSAEDVGALLTAAVRKGWHDWKGAILFGYFTGARLQDVANMQWKSIDLQRQILEFLPRKTARSNKKVMIPLHAQLEQFLLSRPAAESEAAFLFPSLAGRRTGGAHGLSRRFSELMSAAGISSDVARPKKENGKGRAVSKLSFHSLRHGFNSTMANRGVNQELRQKLTGHTTAEMNTLYTQHEIQTLRNAVGVIPTLVLPSE
jgi:integrase